MTDIRGVAWALVLSVGLHAGVALGLRGLGLRPAREPTPPPLYVDLVEPIVAVSGPPPLGATAPAPPRPVLPRARKGDAAEGRRPGLRSLEVSPPRNSTTPRLEPVPSPLRYDSDQPSSEPVRIVHAEPETLARPMPPPPPAPAPLPAPHPRIVPKPASPVIRPPEPAPLVELPAPLAAARAAPGPLDSALPRSAEGGIEVRRTDPASSPSVPAPTGPAPGVPPSQPVGMSRTPEGPFHAGHADGAAGLRDAPVGGSAPRADELARVAAPVGQSARARTQGTEEVTALPSGPGTMVSPEHESYLRGLRRRIQERLVYPWLAVRRGLHGVIELEVQLDLAGRLVGVSAVTGGESPLLRDAALQAVRDATPFPFPPDLSPRALTIRLPVVFELR